MAVALTDDELKQQFRMKAAKQAGAAPGYPQFAGGNYGVGPQPMSQGYQGGGGNYGAVAPPPPTNASPPPAPATEQMGPPAPRGPSLTGTVPGGQGPGAFNNPALSNPFGAGAGPAQAPAQDPSQIGPDDIKRQHAMTLQTHMNRIADITDQMSRMPAGTPEYAQLNRDRAKYGMMANRLRSVLNPSALPEVPSMDEASAKVGRDRLEMNTNLQTAGRDRFKAGYAAGNAGEMDSGQNLEARADTAFPLYDKGGQQAAAQKMIAYRQAKRNEAEQAQQQAAMPLDLEARGEITARRQGLDMNRAQFIAAKKNVEAGGDVAEAAGTKARVETAGGKTELDPAVQDKKKQILINKAQAEQAVTEGQSKAAQSAVVQGENVAGTAQAGIPDAQAFVQEAAAHAQNTAKAMGSDLHPNGEAGVVYSPTPAQSASANHLSTVAVPRIQALAKSNPRLASQMASQILAQMPPANPQGGYFVGNHWYQSASGATHQAAQLLARQLTDARAELERIAGQ